MDITLEFLKNVYDLCCPIGIFWEDLTDVSQEFIDKNTELLNKKLEQGKLKKEKFAIFLETLNELQKVVGLKLQHAELKDSTHQYDWVNFTTTIFVSNNHGYMLMGEFCPAEGYYFKELIKF